jgi:hypothetical protein
LKRLVVVALVTVLAASLSGCGGDKARKRSSTTTTTNAPSTSLPPTTTPLPAGFPTPEDAIRDYVEAHGHEYVGDCAGTDPATDVGKWCSALATDNGSSRIYGIGPAFAEFAEQLTLENGPGGWLVTGSAPAPAAG